MCGGERESSAAAERGNRRASWPSTANGGQLRRAVSAATPSSCPIWRSGRGDLDDPALVEEYRRRALERSRRYSWDPVADQYGALLRGVLVARGPGRMAEHLLHSDRGVAVG